MKVAWLAAVAVILAHVRPGPGRVGPVVGRAVHAGPRIGRQPRRRRPDRRLYFATGHGRELAERHAQRHGRPRVQREPSRAAPGTGNALSSTPPRPWTSPAPWPRPRKRPAAGSPRLTRPSASPSTPPSDKGNLVQPFTADKTPPARGPRPRRSARHRGRPRRRPRCGRRSARPPARSSNQPELSAEHRDHGRPERQRQRVGQGRRHRRASPAPRPRSSASPTPAAATTATS